MTGAEKKFREKSEHGFKESRQKRKNRTKHQGAGGADMTPICVNRMFKTEKEKWETVRYW
ncbi:MAG: hypothetical protein ACLTAS_02485 [Butyribacter sp.]